MSAYRYMLEDRERQLRASKAPGNTFKCGKCGQCKGLLGRKKLRVDGRRIVYQCKQCAAEKGVAFNDPLENEEGTA